MLAFEMALDSNQPEQRWVWVREAVDLLRGPALRANPLSSEIHGQLSYLFWFKIGEFQDEGFAFHRPIMFAGRSGHKHPALGLGAQEMVGASTPPSIPGGGGAALPHHCSGSAFGPSSGSGCSPEQRAGVPTRASSLSRCESGPSARRTRCVAISIKLMFPLGNHSKATL